MLLIAHSNHYIRILKSIGFNSIRVTHTQRPYIVFRNRFLYGFVLVYICQDGSTVGFVAFTKLSFTLSSLAQPFDQI